MRRTGRMTNDTPLASMTNDTPLARLMTSRLRRIDDKEGHRRRAAARSFVICHLSSHLPLLANSADCSFTTLSTTSV
jgi:hypothetical protein